MGFIGDDSGDDSSGDSSDDSSGDSSGDSSDDSGSLVTDTSGGSGDLSGLQLGGNVTPGDIKDSLTSGVSTATQSYGDLGNQLAQGNYSGLVQNGVLDASKVAGAAISTYDKAQTAAGAFNTAAGVDFTGQKTQAQQLEVAAVFTAVATIIGGAWGAAMGAAFTALLKARGAAHAGYGACATSPPAGSTFPQLKAWSHYTGWADPSNYGKPYPASPPGSFEAWANPLLEYNFALRWNCFGGITLDNGVKEPGLYQAPPILLALLVQTWNKLHTGPTRTITRKAPACMIGQDEPPDFDPISASLPWTLDGGCPTQAQLSIIVNNGPPVKEIKLHLSPIGTTPVTPGQMAAALGSGAVRTGTTTPGTKAAIVAAGGATAAGGYLVYTAGGVKPAVLLVRRLLGF
jgi:hypothetical protein